MTLAHANAEGPLIIIGGHENKDGDKVILKAVAERLKGGRLVIATVASHNPEGYFETYQKAFEPLGIKELVELILLIVKDGLGAGFRSYLNIWNCIDWFNLTMSFIIMMLFYDVTRYVASVNELVLSLPTLDAVEPSPQWTGRYTKTVEQFHQDALQVGRKFYRLRWITSIFAVSTMLGFFKAFRANPRLDKTPPLSRALPGGFGALRDKREDRGITAATCPDAY